MIACAAPLARHAELIAARRRRVASPSALQAHHADSRRRSMRRSGVNPWLALSIAIVLALVGGLFSPRLAVAYRFSRRRCRLHARSRLHGNMLSNFADGEYLIWHLPASRVFIDGRYDTVYPQQVVNQYLEFINGRSRRVCSVLQRLSS